MSVFVEGKPENPDKNHRSKGGTNKLNLQMAPREESNPGRTGGKRVLSRLQAQTCSTVEREFFRELLQICQTQRFHSLLEGWLIMFDQSCLEMLHTTCLRHASWLNSGFVDKKSETQVMDTLGPSLTDPVSWDHFHVRSRLNRPDLVMPGPKAFGTDFVCYVVSLCRRMRQV